MRIILIVLSAMIISCNPAKKKELALSKAQKDSAIVVAKRFFQTWYDSSYRIDDYFVYHGSMKSFLIFPKRLCRNNIEYKLDQLRASASDTNSLITVSVSLYKYDLFQKKDNLISTDHIFMDTTYRVALIHCDSGLIYREY